MSCTICIKPRPAADLQARQPSLISQWKRREKRFTACICTAPSLLPSGCWCFGLCRHQICSIIFFSRLRARFLFHISFLTHKSVSFSSICCVLKMLNRFFGNSIPPADSLAYLHKNGTVTTVITSRELDPSLSYSTANRKSSKSWYDRRIWWEKTTRYFGWASDSGMEQHEQIYLLRVKPSHLIPLHRCHGRMEASNSPSSGTRGLHHHFCFDYRCSGDFIAH